MSLRIVFMGTPDFAVPSLDILIKNGFNVVAVITSTDKWGGRGNKKLLESDVKKYAQEQGLKILQPPNLKNKAFLEELAALKADLQVVVAFRMLPRVVWDMPRLGTINLHGSLLPKYRGAAPINWAVIRGEKETGVSTFFLKHKIDTGNLLFQSKTTIGENETVGELYNRLKYIGADLMLKTLKAVEKEDYTPLPQDDALATKAPKIFHENCHINFEQSTQAVHDFVRGLSPYPAAWTLVDGQKLKIFQTLKEIVKHDLKAGTIVTDHKKYLKIATLDGFIQLINVQLTKRKRMDIKSFLNGYTIENSEVPAKIEPNIAN
ncbi:MAG: methionyl-tRNA formyltransferase [Saprospiraceae bacterium]|nr:methionyl-tRNA formyltransferase [Saprospiraceae bacterium]